VFEVEGVLRGRGPLAGTVETVENPTTMDPDAVEKAVVLIASASYILQLLHSPDPLAGGVLLWLLWRLRTT
jgi:hypothetical protein